MPPGPDHPLDADHPAVEDLRKRLEAEEGSYADVLAAVDRLADFELPADQFGALVHPHDSQPVRPTVVIVGGILCSKTAAIVRNSQRQPGIETPQLDGQMLRVGVIGDVGERLLCNPVNRLLNIRTHAAQARRDVKIQFQPGAGGGR